MLLASVRSLMWCGLIVVSSWVPIPWIRVSHLGTCIAVCGQGLLLDQAEGCLRDVSSHKMMNCGALLICVLP
jgi:hypothetical protein